MVEKPLKSDSITETEDKKPEELTENEIEIKDKLLTNLNIDDLVIFKSFLDFYGSLKTYLLFNNKI